MMHRNLIAQTDCEINKFKELLALTKDVPGDIAEVGVFHGGSASIIYDDKAPLKKLYLFDTYVDDYDGVVRYFGDKKDVEIIKKDFNGSGEYGDKFSFVHIDTDLFDSTYAALKYFYPRMSTGGVIIVHDFTHVTCSGPNTACTLFFEDKPEKVIKNDSQGYYIKL